MIPGEYEIEAEDGCIWSLSWFQDASAFFADVWEWAPDDEVGGNADSESTCTCPFPVLGTYDTLETIELALGSKIPPPIREELGSDARNYPAQEEDKSAWGRIWAAEVFRTADDGMIVSSFAPPWEDDPLDPRWEADNFPLP